MLAHADYCYFKLIRQCVRPTEILFGHDWTPNFCLTIWQYNWWIAINCWWWINCTHRHGLIFFSLVLQNWVPQIHILFWQQPSLRSPNLDRLAGSCYGGEGSWREMELCQKCSSSAASFHDLEWKFIDWLLCLQLSKVNFYARHSIHAAPVPHHFCSFLNGSFVCIVCKPILLGKLCAKPEPASVCCCWK